MNLANIGSLLLKLFLCGLSKNSFPEFYFLICISRTDELIENWFGFLVKMPNVPFAGGFITLEQTALLKF